MSNEVEKPEHGQRIHLRQRHRHLGGAPRPTTSGCGAISRRFLVRPVPKTIWPNKYADLRRTGAAVQRRHRRGLRRHARLGSARSARRPGIVADFWLEVWWLAPLLMAAVGLGLRPGVGKRAVTRGGPWASPIRHHLGAVHLPRHADRRSGHLPHARAFHPLLDGMALGAQRPACPQASRPFLCAQPDGGLYPPQWVPAVRSSEHPWHAPAPMATA